MRDAIRNWSKLFKLAFVSFTVHDRWIFRRILRRIQPSAGSRACTPKQRALSRRPSVDFLPPPKRSKSLQLNTLYVKRCANTTIHLSPGSARGNHLRDSNHPRIDNAYNSSESMQVLAEERFSIQNPERIPPAISRASIFRSSAG